MAVILMLIIAFIVYPICKRLLTKPKQFSIYRKHVVITGGSSAIGKCVAMLSIKKGANVTIIGRNPAKLASTRIHIKKYIIHRSQKVSALSLDLSDKTKVMDWFDRIERSEGPIAMLVNCAGMPLCGIVEQFSEDAVKTLISSNYLATLFPIQCVVPRMKRRGEGVIVLTGSTVSLMGMYGYSVYSSTKFALRGLAESIAMELKPYNVSVTLALSPATEKPELEEENNTKLEETQLICASTALVDPEVAAERMLRDALRGNFFSYVGRKAYLLTTLCAGVTPCVDFLQLIGQAIILGPLRLFAAYYVKKFERIVQICYNNRNE